MDLQGCTKPFPLQPGIDRNHQLCRHTLPAEPPCSPAMAVVHQEGQECVMTLFTLWTVSLAVLGSLSPCSAAAPQPTRWHSGCAVQAPASKFTQLNQAGDPLLLPCPCCVSSTAQLEHKAPVQKKCLDLGRALNCRAVPGVITNSRSVFSIHMEYVPRFTFQILNRAFCQVK